MSYQSISSDNESVVDFTILDYLESVFLHNRIFLDDLSHSNKNNQLIQNDINHDIIVIKFVNLLELETLYSSINQVGIKSLISLVSQQYKQSIMIQLSYDTFLLITLDNKTDFFSLQLKEYFRQALKNLVTEYSYIIVRAGYSKKNLLTTYNMAVKQAYIALHEACNRKIPCFDYDNIKPYNATKIEDIILLKDLEKIIDSNSLSLLFHPIVYPHNYQVYSYEALSRGNNYNNYIKSSLKLNIEAAERLGFISYFDWITLGMVIRELIINKNIIIHLNISPLSLGDLAWVNKAISILGDKNIAERLVLEITETSFHHNVDELSSTIYKLTEIGCTIAIDDFGTGYASFGLLRKLPIKFLKIDGSYIKDIDKNISFIDCILNIGKTINAKIVAEFVEDKETAEKLKDLGVHYLQGHYFYNKIWTCNQIPAA